MSGTVGGGTPSFLNSLVNQAELVNSVLRSYHMSYKTVKIQVDAKEKAVYYITKISCDEGYEYICERLIEEYINQAKNQKRNDVEMKNVIEENKK